MLLAPNKLQNEIIFMPSLQIVSKVVGKKVSQAPELKRSVSKHRKSESDFSSTKSTTESSHLKVGSKVKFPLSNKTAHGILRFIGPTKFSTGQWCGIELSRPDGRNNGTVKGVKYFQCKINYGIFVHAEKVTLDEEENVETRQRNSTSEPQSELKSKSKSESVKNQGTQSNQASSNNNNIVGDDWIVYEEKPLSINENDDRCTGQFEKSPETTGETRNDPLSTGNTENKLENTSSFVQTTKSGSNLDDENMRAIVAAALEVENSPLTIKIAKSVSDDDNNNTIENVAKSEFGDGLLFYVTAHQAAPMAQRDRYKSCPILSSSSSDEDIFADENKSNTWPKYLKSVKRNVEDEGFHKGPTNLRRRLSGIEKRIRLSHFRPPSPGSLKKSLSQSAVYPKENYVAYDESTVRRPRFPASLKRSVSNVTEYNTNKAFVGASNRPCEFHGKGWLRRETIAIRNDEESDDEGKSTEYDRSRTEKSHDRESDIKEEMKIDVEDCEDVMEKTDVNDMSNSFVVIDDISNEDEEKSDEPAEAVDHEGVSLSSTSLVEEDLVIIDRVKFDEAPVEADDTYDQSALKETISDFQFVSSPVLKKEEKPKRLSDRSEVLKKSSSGQQGSGLPVFAKAHPAKNLNQNRDQPASKIATRKTSTPVLAGKKESLSNIRPMSNRLSHSHAELSSKTETPRASVDNKGRLPKKLNKRVSDLVANFEKTKDGSVQQKGSKSGAVGSSVAKTEVSEKKQLNFGKRRESANERDTRSSGVAVTPRKTSQVNKEELAGKEALSKQFLKDDGNKKLGHTHKDASVGNQTTSKSSISTARSGIPGYGKRSHKASVETPKKPPASLKYSAVKQEKPNDVPKLSSGKERSVNFKSIEPSSKAQEQIKELKVKCLGCEKQINQLKDELKEKNLAMEAFVIIIKQYIKTIEEQNGRQVQLLRDNRRLDSELKHQTNVAVSNGGKYKDLETSIASLADEYKEQIELLKTEHDRETRALLEELNQKHEQEMGQANTKFDKELTKLKDYHDEKISKLQAEHEADMNSLKDDFEKAFNLKDEEFSKTKEDITNLFKEEKEEICLEYEERIQDLQNQLISSEQQCSEFEEKARQLQSEFDKDLESKLQGALAKYKNLPAELDSLQAVVEMKNEDIKKSRAHNMELQKRLEDYYELEKKYVKLTQEKEAVDAALQNKTKYERQLSVEKESLQANLEKEARKVKRLSMEKEELLWKVSNANSSLSLSSPSLNVDLSSTPNGFQSTPNSTRSHNRSLKTQSLYLPPLDDEDYTVL